MGMTKKNAKASTKGILGSTTRAKCLSYYPWVVVALHWKSRYIGKSTTFITGSSRFIARNSNGTESAWAGPD